MSDPIPQKITSWQILGRELRKRTVEPLSHASFVMYFIVAVLLVGGAGIALELHAYYFFAPTAEHLERSVAGVRVAIITFFPALAGSSCMQLIWAEDHHKSLRAFAICVLAILTVIVLAIAPSAVSHTAALWIGSVASFVALWTWWIANAKQRDLLDPQVTLGKEDPGSALSGTLDGFTV